MKLTNIFILALAVLASCGPQVTTVSHNGQRVTDLERRMLLNEELDKVQNDLLTLSASRLDALEGASQASGAEQVLLQAQIALLNSGIATISSEVSAVQSQLSTLTSDISSLEGVVSGLGTDITTLSGRVDDIEVALTQVSSGSSLTNYSATSCEPISGTALYGKGSSSKYTLYSGSTCSSPDKVTELSNSSPIYWLSAGELAVYQAQSKLVVIGF